MVALYLLYQDKSYDAYVVDCERVRVFSTAAIRAFSKNT